MTKATDKERQEQIAEMDFIAALVQQAFDEYVNEQASQPKQTKEGQLLLF